MPEINKYDKIDTELSSLAYHLRALSKEMRLYKDKRVIETIEGNIKFSFYQLDSYKVPFRIQNECIYLAQNTDRPISEIVADLMQLVMQVIK